MKTCPGHISEWSLNYTYFYKLWFIYLLKMRLDRSRKMMLQIDGCERIKFCFKLWCKTFWDPLACCFNAFFSFQNNKNTFPLKRFPIKRHSTKTWHRTGFIFVFLLLLFVLLFIIKFIFVNPYSIWMIRGVSLHLMWRWRKLIIFDSVNCANSAVTQVRVGSWYICTK